MSENYFVGVNQKEIERLKAQHQAWHVHTSALWQRAGFSTGHRIADLGTGPGLNAIDLAKIVGSSGSISAFDKATTFLKHLHKTLEEANIHNVTTYQTDITTCTELEGGPYDGAFCRWFLAYLIESLDSVISSIYKSLKPGGVFACMEYLTLASTVCSPPIEGFDAHTEAWIKWYKQHGGDTNAGMILPSKFAEAGFSIESIECIGEKARPSDPLGQWWGQLFEDFGEKFVDEKLMTADELQKLLLGWSKISKGKDSFIYTPVLVQITARKPL